jgi:hypothetical protein
MNLAAGKPYKPRLERTRRTSGSGGTRLMRMADGGHVRGLIGCRRIGMPI